MPGITSGHLTFPHMIPQHALEETIKTYRSHIPVFTDGSSTIKSESFTFLIPLLPLPMQSRLSDVTSSTAGKLAGVKATVSTMATNSS